MVTPLFQMVRCLNSAFLAPESPRIGTWGYGTRRYQPVPLYIWVANREKPINDTSGVFEVGREGSLQILSARNTLIWSSNSTVSVTSRSLEVQLLDRGNLVLWDEHTTKENPIWQSFDYPGDTILPGMKIGKDLVTGKERYLTSWKSPDDPSKGLYNNWINTNGYPQIFEREGRALHSRLGPWNGVGFRGFPIDNPNPVYWVEFVFNEKEIYYRYQLKSSVVQRIHVSSDGICLQLNWIERTQKWVVYGNVLVDSCGRYGRCGPYGTCSISVYPPCRCMEGFEPRFPKEWNAADWSGGCHRKQPLRCENGDGFRKISGLNFPDTQHSWYNVSMTLEECEMACRKNCSCTAYANLDIRNGGSGCLLWFDELMDIREYDEKQELYIRMAASELTGNRNALDKKDTSVQMEDLDALPFFSLYEIAKATDNFSINNKIGEGGFGPVYKRSQGSGYISPEYAVHGRFSIKSDVFSFGVLVLEIVSGKKNRGFSHEDHSDNLLGHAWRLYKEDKSIEIMCASLRNSCIVSEVLRAIHVGLLCVQHHAKDRPTMLSVVLMLVSESELPPPKQPAFFTEESYSEHDYVSSLDEYMITLLYAR
ncbi:hypothetical protein L6452_14242 [Arctium lappa]|uniref:Uncharacterized protein n=1 Tax=Arctium lappa TaxID=4217 RepID=A0ACB9CKH4_ARCLA|nr:hypothetical protein L6452_14242 [Arctium lappa]